MQWVGINALRMQARGWGRSFADPSGNLDWFIIELASSNDSTAALMPGTLCSFTHTIWYKRHTIEQQVLPLRLVLHASTPQINKAASTLMQLCALHLPLAHHGERIQNGENGCHMTTISISHHATCRCTHAHAVFYVEVLGCISYA